MTSIEQINQGAAKHIKRASATRWTAWGEWADGTRCTSEAGMTGPETNRQTIAWRRQGAARVGMTRDAA